MAKELEFIQTAALMSESGRMENLMDQENIQNKGITYEGQFFNGLAHGEGEMRYSEGAYYNGPWKDGVKHGQN